MKSVLMIIAEKNFRDEEYQKPKEVLENAGLKVVSASASTNMAVGKLGLKVKPDLALRDVIVDDYDAVIFIGGPGAEQYFHDNTAFKIATEAATKNKIYGAICIAPTILANAGLLKNKKATSFESAVDSIKEQGAKYVEENVVVDGRLVTADGPKSATKFGEAILHLLFPKKEDHEYQETW